MVIIVLLADDNALALRYLSQLVDWMSLGFEMAVMANDGKEAWEQYNSRKPQVIIMDMQMPGKDGCEVVGQIREKDKETILLFFNAKKIWKYC